MYIKEKLHRAQYESVTAMGKLANEQSSPTNGHWMLSGRKGKKTRKWLISTLSLP